MIRMIKGLALACVLAIGAGSAQAASISLVVSAGSPNIPAPGGTVTFDVVFNDSVAAFSQEVQLNFDASVVNAAAAVTLPCASGGFCQFNTLADNTAGTVRVGIANLNTVPGQELGGGTFTLGTVTFTGVGLGSSNIIVDPVFGSPDNGGAIAATVTVGVPEPNTLVMLGLGLAALAGIRRRA